MREKPFFQKVNDKIYTTIAEPDFTSHVKLNMMEIRFHYFRCKVADEMFSKGSGFTIAHTRLNRIPEIRKRSKKRIKRYIVPGEKTVEICERPFLGFNPRIRFSLLFFFWEVILGDFFCDDLQE